MKLVPMLGRVVVERDEAANKSEGGILLPDTAKENPKRGKVIAVAPGKWQAGHFVECILKPGDSVIFGGFAGSEVEVDGKSYLIMDTDEILAVLK